MECAGVTQLARVPAFQADCCGFESRHPLHWILEYSTARLDFFYKKYCNYKLNLYTAITSVFEKEPFSISRLFFYFKLIHDFTILHFPLSLFAYPSLYKFNHSILILRELLHKEFISYQHIQIVFLIYQVDNIIHSSFILFGVCS